MMSDNNIVVQDGKGKNIEFDQIINLKLINVFQAFKKRINERFVIYVVLPILSVILSLVLAPLLLFRYGNMSILAIGIFWPFVLYAYLYFSLTTKFIKDFALGVGFDYMKSAEMVSVEGTIFKRGHSQRISEVVSGSYYNHKTRFFTFTTVEGSGKNQTTNYFSVLEIKFDMMLPDIILNSRDSLFGLNMFFLGDEKKLELEGDFGKYFNLYAPEDYEIEVFQIFSPDIMQMFIEKMKGLNMEIFKDRVYIYQWNRVSKKDNIVLMYGLARDIISKLGPTFEGMKGGVEAMSKYFELT